MRAISAIGILIGGLLIGYSIGAYTHSKPCPIGFDNEDEAQEKEVPTEEPAKTSEPHEAASNQTIFEKSLDEKNYFSYTKIADQYKAGEEDESEDIEDDEDQSDDIYEDLDEDEEAELEAIYDLQEESTEEPYSICEQEFDQNPYDYTQESWTYYIDDMLIADSWGNPVGIPEMFVGNAFDIMRNALDGTIMHWRAPQNRMEIELVASRDPYSDSYVPQREALQRKVAEERKKGGK